MSKTFREAILGVDIENGFTPEYQVIKDKVKILKEIKKAAEKAKEIYLATDPDREGEAIAWHVVEELNRRPRNGRTGFCWTESPPAASARPCSTRST